MRAAQDERILLHSFVRCNASRDKQPCFKQAGNQARKAGFFGDCTFCYRKGDDEVSKVLRILMTAEAEMEAKGAEVAAKATLITKSYYPHLE